MQNNKKNYIKYIIGFIFCMLVRLIPFRAPNVEPILATQMPFAKIYGKTFGFLFGFLSIVLFDLLTMKLGLHTLITGVTYGALGVWAVSFFKNKTENRMNYVYFAILGTLFFDIVTGIIAGPVFFHQSFAEAAMGQIPFTLLHLAGNITFAYFLSPLIYKYTVKNKKIKFNQVSSLLTFKKI